MAPVQHLETGIRGWPAGAARLPCALARHVRADRRKLTGGYSESPRPPPLEGRWMPQALSLANTVLRCAPSRRAAWLMFHRRARARAGCTGARTAPSPPGAAGSAQQTASWLIRSELHNGPRHASRDLEGPASDTHSSCSIWRRQPRTRTVTCQSHDRERFLVPGLFIRDWGLNNQHAD